MQTPSGPVTLRVGWPTLALALPVLGFVDLGLGWAVVDALRHGWRYPWRDSGLHTTGMVVGWCIAGVFLTLCPLATLALPALRVRFAGDRVRLRKLGRWSTIRLADLRSVVVTNPPSWMVNGPRSSVAPCLELRGTTPSGRRAYIGINAKMLDYTAGLRWLAPWLRAHPDRTDAHTLALLDHLDGLTGPQASDAADEPRRPVDVEDLMAKYRDDLRR